MIESNVIGLTVGGILNSNPITINHNWDVIYALWVEQNRKNEMNILELTDKELEIITSCLGDRPYYEVKIIFDKISSAKKKITSPYQIPNIATPGVTFPVAYPTEKNYTLNVQD